MNRRSDKLDKFLNKKVLISFTDYTMLYGILEFDKPRDIGLGPSGMYSISNIFGNTTFFRKNHVKRIIG